MQEEIMLLIIDIGFGICKSGFPGDDDRNSCFRLLLGCPGCHGGHGAEGPEQAWHPYPELPYGIVINWYTHGVDVIPYILQPIVYNP